MARFQVLAPQSLTERVAAQIRDGIAAGRLRPGERLVEAEIASQMGISRAPVREALRQVEFEGLVEGRARRGYVVRELSVGGLLEVYDLRLLLEPVLAEAAAARVGPDDLEALRAIVDRMREAARRDDWTAVVDADRAFHGQVGKLSGRPLTAQIFEHLNEQVRRFTALMRSSYDDVEQMADEHEALLATLASGTPEQAGREMRSHLEDARRRLASIIGEHAERDGRQNGAARTSAPRGGTFSGADLNGRGRADLEPLGRRGSPTA